MKNASFFLEAFFLDRQKNVCTKKIPLYGGININHFYSLLGSSSLLRFAFCPSNRKLDALAQVIESGLSSE